MDDSKLLDDNERGIKLSSGSVAIFASLVVSSI